jgi:hypothetical protein
MATASWVPRAFTVPDWPAQAANEQQQEFQQLMHDSCSQVVVSLAMGGKVIKCPSPLNVLKYKYDHSCYWTR